MQAKRLVKTLLEEPAVDDFGGKRRAYALLNDAVLAQLPEGSKATNERGVYSFAVQDYGQLKILANWVVASPKPRVDHHFGGDTIDAVANAIVLTRHQDEVAELSDKLRRQVTAKRLGGE
jgi:hypothetical protein